MPCRVLWQRLARTIGGAAAFRGSELGRKGEDLMPTTVSARRVSSRWLAVAIGLGCGVLPISAIAQTAPSVIDQIKEMQSEIKGIQKHHEMEMRMLEKRHQSEM